MIRQLHEVGRHLTGLVRGYPHEILRGGIKNAVAVERYYLTAKAIGVSREDADRTLSESRKDLTEWPWWFDVAEDAERRLKLAAFGVSRPSAEYRRAAQLLLTADAELYERRFTPADVDALAIRLQAGWLK